MRALGVFLGISLVVCTGCERKPRPIGKDPELRPPDTTPVDELDRMQRIAEEANRPSQEKEQSKLRSPEPEVRGFAARALGKMGPEAKGAVPALTEMLRDQATYTVPFRGVVETPFGKMATVGKKMVYVRANAAEALGSIGPEAEAAIPALLESLQDWQAEVRKAAADALGNIGPTAKEAVPDLTRLLRDKESGVRGFAARALGKIGSEAKPAIRALTELLHDEPMDGVGPKTGHVCDIAAEALQQIGPEAAIPALRDLLSDEGAEARRSAAKGLGLFGPEAKTAIPDLIAALRDQSWEVRRTATETLGEIGPEAKAATPKLVNLLLENDEDDGHIASVERMERALGVRKAIAKTLRKIGPEAISDLTELLHGNDERVRTAAAYALGEIGPEAMGAIPDLKKLLDDDNEQVRTAAGEALKRLGLEER